MAGEDATSDPSTDAGTPATISGVSNRRGSVRSAVAPPVQAPIAIAARAKPMTAVLVWTVTPT